MSREEIIAMAREAGAITGVKSLMNVSGDSIVFALEELERFAALAEAKAAANEREACAKLIEGMTERKRWIRGGINGEATKPCEYAAAIRARSNHVA